MSNSAYRTILGAAVVLAGCSGVDGAQENVARSEEAITGGTPDFTHVNVGAVVRQGGDGSWSHVCSGTLIAPSVVLTAGHCTSGHTRLGVTFVQDIAPGSPLPSEILVHSGDAVTHPAYEPDGDGAKATNDVGVIALDDEIDAPLSPLAPAGSLDDLAAAQQLVAKAVTRVVGYGFSKALGLGLGAAEPSNERRQAQMIAQGLTSAMLKSGIDDGGACFGDSGGPTYVEIDGIETLVGVNAIGDGSCAGLLFSYRTDISSTRHFLAAYVSLP